MLAFKSQFRVLGGNFIVPRRIETSEHLAGRLGCDVDWFNENVGVSRRHVAEDWTDPAVLAAEAARPLVERFGEPDALIYASATTRQCIPDTSVFVLRELGLSAIPGFSVNATCLSFLVALQNAALLIRSGMHRKILIASAELPSFSRNFSDPKSAALFGDAAAAVMIENTDRPSGLIHSCMESWPEFAELAQVRGGGLLLHPNNPATTPEDYFFDMNGDQLLRSALPKLKKFITSFFNDVSVDPSNIKLLIPHQASAAGMKVLERLGFPNGKTVNILSQYGNCVSASMPMALAIAESENRVERGDDILFLGTAAGLSIGAALIRW